MPGERAARCYSERTEKGIPVPPDTIATLRKIAADLNVEFIRGVE